MGQKEAADERGSTRIKLGSRRAAEKLNLIENEVSPILFARPSRPYPR